MAKSHHTPAQSLYREVRLTFQQERSGRVNYSLYAKPLNAAWNERQCIVRDSVPGLPTFASTEDVLRAVIRICEEQFLPTEL